MKHHPSWEQTPNGQILSLVSKGLVREPVYQGDEPMVGCKISEENGWVTLKLEDILECSSSALHAYQEFHATVGEWEGNITEEWWMRMRPWHPLDMIETSINMYPMTGPLWKEQNARNVTAAAVVWQHPVPRGLFLLDTLTVEQAMRYMALTQPIKVELSMVSQKEWKPYLPMPAGQQLAPLVQALAGFKQLLAQMFTFKRPPNLLFLRAHMGYPQNLMVFSPDQLRKLFTCIYLTMGLPVPRDYLYLDMEVHDYVLKLGEHEVLTEYHP